MSSNTQRTLAALRDLGRDCGIVERFNPYGGHFGVRQDLFGFIDIVAIDPKDGIIGVQSCGQSYAAHAHKICESCEAIVKRWLKFARIELWGWRKVKLKRGGKAIRWKPRVGEVALLDSSLKIIEKALVHA
jgi:hypothetical protein